MILSEIRDYVEKRGQASLKDICLHFDLEPDAARGMLQVWINKGKLIKVEAKSDCGGCNHCDPLGMEIYAAAGQATCTPLCHL